MFALALLACKDPSADPASAPVVLVSDQDTQRVWLLRLDNGEVLRTFDVPELHPELCTPQTACLPFTAQASVDPTTGDDLLTWTWMVDELTGGREGTRYSYAERRRFARAGQSVDWSLEALDFHAAFADRPDLCDQAAPCELSQGDTPPGRDPCFMGDVHDLEVVEEDESGRRLLLTDTDNARVLEVWLEAGSTCGVVESVVSAETSSTWPWQAVNDADRVELDGRSGLLVTFRSTLPESEGGPVDGSDGRGQIAWFEGEGAAWSPTWAFPEGGYLNTPHDASVHLPPDGAPVLLYAHSNGAGAAFQEDWAPSLDHKGSIGVALLDGEAPAYVGDAVVSGEETFFGFLRSINPAPGGAWILADSGCMSPSEECGRVAAVRQVEGLDLDGLAPSGSTGAFTEDHAEQRWLGVSEVSTPWESPMTCGFGTLYTASFHWRGDLGETFAEPRAGAVCGD